MGQHEPPQKLTNLSKVTISSSYPSAVQTFHHLSNINC